MAENQEKLTNYDVFFRPLGSETVHFVDNFLKACKQVDVSVYHNKRTQEAYTQCSIEKLSRILDNHKDQESDIIKILRIKEEYYQKKTKRWETLLREQKSSILFHKNKKIPHWQIKTSQGTYKTFHYLTIGLVPTIIFLTLVFAALSPLFPPLAVPVSYLTGVLSLTLLVKTVGIVTLSARYLTRKIYKKHKETNANHDCQIGKAQEKVEKYIRKLIVCKILSKVTLSALKRDSAPKDKPVIFKKVLRSAAVQQKKKRALFTENTRACRF